MLNNWGLFSLVCAVSIVSACDSKQVAMPANQAPTRLGSDASASGAPEQAQQALSLSKSAGGSVTPRVINVTKAQAIAMAPKLGFQLTQADSGGSPSCAPGEQLKTVSVKRCNDSTKAFDATRCDNGDGSGFAYLLSQCPTGLVYGVKSINSQIFRPNQIPMSGTEPSKVAQYNGNGLMMICEGTDQPARFLISAKLNEGKYLDTVPSGCGNLYVFPL